MNTTSTITPISENPKQPQQRQTAKEMIAANVKCLIEQLRESPLLVRLNPRSNCPARDSAMKNSIDAITATKEGEPVSLQRKGEDGRTFIAVIHERSHRKPLWRQKLHWPHGNSSGSDPLRRWRLTGISGIHPIDMPARLQLQYQRDIGIARWRASWSNRTLDAGFMRDNFGSLIGWVFFGLLFGLFLQVFHRIVFRIWGGEVEAAIVPTTPIRIVILGGGFAGMRAAERLEALLKSRHDATITLVVDAEGVGDRSNRS